MEKQLEQQHTDCIKVVLYGPESTGKTTLAKALAEHYNTEWVPEFARDYLQEKWNKQKQICELDDILQIASGQIELENSLLARANKVLICDTNLLETAVYSQAYFDGFCEPLLLKQALKAHYHLYFLTYIDIPWVDDDLRDRPHQRELLFGKFKEALDIHEKPYQILRGDLQERFQEAVKTIDELIKKNKVLDLTKEDKFQIEEKGLTTREVERQINIFERGNVVVNVREAATIKNGILSLEESAAGKFIDLYDKKRDELEILKFVPASGAATRMFKAFYQFLEEYDPEHESIEEYTDRKNDPKLEHFFSKMENLPFYKEVRGKVLENNPHYQELSPDEQQLLFVKAMLDEEGADLGDYPKGLVPFHKYEDRVLTAFEEHLVEAADYASSNGVAKVHFTVSEEHREKFEQEFNNIQGRVEEKTGVSFEVSYSFQDPKTDTIAVTKENEPFRDEDGKIFFRPGGHGALLENLNSQEADIIFIKNIDNVVIPKYRDVLIKNKKMLAGKLLSLQSKTFEYLRKLQKEISEAELDEIISFTQKQLNTGLSIRFQDLEKSEKISVLIEKLNRPMRVCGMVKNEGEPGGGPFWVTHKTGEISLQIVESSQIDHENYQQSKIAQEATHFNPVDVVCGKKNFKGENFDLLQYVDEETSFIANKTKDGKELKALERPGLWNGGMADWISIFVEVPIDTFNPVKTVADLLKPTHQVN